jgi:hypothetical protein
MEEAQPIGLSRGACGRGWLVWDLGGDLGIFFGGGGVTDWGIG